MVTVDLDQTRTELMQTGLPADLADSDPVQVVQEWISFAWDAGMFNADAMAVASVDVEGRPSVRNVLMKDVIDGGFCFYTNYESQKGVELLATGAVEALFSWLPLERQIRVRGTVELVTAEQSDRYFDTRPRGSQIAAVASDQSREIPSREWIEQRYREVETEHEGSDVPRPEHWGGLRIVPERIEFWQGHRFRLHNRLVFERIDDGAWTTAWLAP